MNPSATQRPSPFDAIAARPYGWSGQVHLGAPVALKPAMVMSAVDDDTQTPPPFVATATGQFGAWPSQSGLPAGDRPATYPSYSPDGAESTVPVPRPNVPRNAPTTTAFP